MMKTWAVGAVVAAVVFAAASPGARFGAASCTVQEVHASLASPQVGPAAIEVLNGKPSARHALFSSGSHSCALHSHGPCVQIFSNPAPASRVLQRPIVPAPPMGLARAIVSFVNAHSGTEFASRGALSPLRFGQTRSPILRC